MPLGEAVNLVHPEHVNQLCGELKPLLEAELAAGNSVADTWAAWPQTGSLYIRLGSPFKAPPKLHHMPGPAPHSGRPLGHTGQLRRSDMSIVRESDGHRLKPHRGGMRLPAASTCRPYGARPDSGTGRYYRHVAPLGLGAGQQECPTQCPDYRQPVPVACCPHTIVSPRCSPTARSCSLTPTDQMCS